MIFYCTKCKRRLGNLENGKCPFCSGETYKAKMCKECLLEKNIADIGADGICNKCKEENK